jgi:glycerol-3-phosphate O-acyltransferase
MIDSRMVLRVLEEHPHAVLALRILSAFTQPVSMRRLTVPRSDPNRVVRRVMRTMYRKPRNAEFRLLGPVRNDS